MSGRIVSVDEAIRLLTEYKKNGGENVLFSSFDLETRSPDCEAIPISVNHGIKVIRTGNSIMYNKNFIMSSLKTHDNDKEKTILFSERGLRRI